MPDAEREVERIAMRANSPRETSWQVICDYGFSLRDAEKLRGLIEASLTRCWKEAIEDAAKVAENHTQEARDRSALESHAHGIIEWTCKYCAKEIAAAIREKGEAGR